MNMRLAMRVEGNSWNAYMAMENTMEGAVLIGSLALGIAQKHEDIKDEFMALMRKVMAEALKTIGATVEDWNERPAPAHERGGSA